jgi:hypothetical protein
MQVDTTCARGIYTSFRCRKRKSNKKLKNPVVAFGAGNNDGDEFGITRSTAVNDRVGVD